MRSRLARLLSTFVLLLSSLISLNQAHAVEPIAGLVNCATYKSTSCIESISLTRPDGTKLSATLTGKEFPWVQKYAEDSIINSVFQEYEVKGLTFGGTSDNKFIIPITYFPIGNRDCYYTPCVEGKEFIQIEMRPPFVNTLKNTVPIHFDWSDTDKICGSKDNLTFCYPPNNFGSRIKFEFALRLPADFTSTAINGRGLENLTVVRDPRTVSIDGKLYQKVTISFENLAYTSYGYAGAALDQERGVMEVDTPDLVIWGANSRIVNMFGKCKSLEGISVTSNSFWIDMPTWDSNLQEMKIGLHGAHLKSDGSLNLINFQAIITGAMAECLWGINLANKVGATVSLDYADGKTPIIQTISSKFENGVYRIVANGLHLSSPTLTLKLTEEKNVVSQVSPKITKTITCFKGKILKKVTALAPKCPSGYKLKK